MLNMYDGKEVRLYIYMYTHTCVRANKSLAWCTNGALTSLSYCSQAALQLWKQASLDITPTRRPACFTVRPEGHCWFGISPHPDCTITQPPTTTWINSDPPNNVQKRRSETEETEQRHSLEEVALEVKLINVMSFIRKMERNCVVSITDGKLFEVLFLSCRVCLLLKCLND